MAERLQQLFPVDRKSDLQAILNLKRNAINRRLAGDVGLSDKELAAIGQATGCGIEWLTTGKGEKYPNAPRLSSFRAAEGSPAYVGVRLPCYSYAAADSTKGALVFDDIEQDEDYILPTDRVLMQVHGNSMADVAWPGQRLMLAGPERSAHSGDLVVALVAGQGCLFKRLVIESVGDEQRYIFLSANSRDPQPVLSVSPDHVNDLRVVVGVIYE